MCKLDNAANKTNIAFFISSNNFYRANVAKVEQTTKLACICFAETHPALFKGNASREKNNQACLKLLFRGAVCLIEM